MKLCRSHLTQLRKVNNQLAVNQTMNYVPLLLCQNNHYKIEKARKQIREAIEILETVE